MSGARFARTGRCRFLVCLGILVLMVGMVAIFHSSQVQLDESREQRLHCEQQQEALNDRLKSLVEQKYHLERNQERERTEHMENERNLNIKIKEIQKEQTDIKTHYDKLKKSHDQLQNDHKHLREANEKSTNQQREQDRKMESLRSELQKEKSNQSGEINIWKEKYTALEKEKTSKDQHIRQLENKLKDYERNCDYKYAHKGTDSVGSRADFLQSPNQYNISKQSFNQQEVMGEGIYHITFNNNTNKPTTSGGDSLTLNKQNGGGGGDDDAAAGAVGPAPERGYQSAKYFTNPTQDLLKTDFKPLITKHFNSSLILNSVENFQIIANPIKSEDGQQQETPLKQKQSDKDDVLLLKEQQQQKVAPLSAPKNNNNNAAAAHQTSSTAKSEQQQQQQMHAALSAADGSKTASANLRSARDSKTSTSSSNSPPLALPPNQRKLPENVAPVPENFEALLQKSNNEELRANNNHEQGADGRQNNLALDDQNSKDHLKQALKSHNFDSGAHEIKDNDQQNAAEDSNLPSHDDINNFFDTDNEAKSQQKLLDGGGGGGVRNMDKDLGDAGDDDDGGGLLGADTGDNDDAAMLGPAAAGDIAVKQHGRQSHDVDDNLNNEVAGDQGKEFDGLRLEENAIDEDDDDDYSNPSARKKAGQAIRN